MLVSPSLILDDQQKYRRSEALDNNVLLPPEWSRFHLERQRVRDGIKPATVPHWQQSADDAAPRGHERDACRVTQSPFHDLYPVRKVADIWPATRPCWG